MDIALLHTATGIAIGVFFYALISRGFFRAAETSRDQLLDIGEKLLARPDLPDSHKDHIEYSLSEVHSAFAAWKIVILFSCLAITSPFHRFSTFANEPFSEVPAALRRDLGRFASRWVMATLANSPLASLVFILIAAIIIAFSASLRSISAVLLAKHDRRSHGPAVPV